MLYIHPDECIDCEACVPECPVEAIFLDDDVPDEWKEFIEPGTRPRLPNRPTSRNARNLFAIDTP